MIEETTIKRCEDCLYCLPDSLDGENAWRFARCKHPKYTLISKNFTESYCSIQRKYPQLCGQEGSLFCPKPYRPPQNIGFGKVVDNEPEVTFKRKWWKITLTVEK